MKKFYFLLVAMFVGIFSAQAARVYFQNTSKWSNVYAYAWDPQNASWPGVLITSNTVTCTNGVTYNYYDTTCPNIIFAEKNGGAQTANLLTEDGAVFSYEANSNSSGYKYPIGSISGNVFTPAGEVQIEYAHIYFPASTYTVAAQNPSLTPHFYTWSDQITAGWPGTKLTKETVNGTEFYVFSIDATNLPATVAGMQLNLGSDTGKKEYTTKTTLKDKDVVDISSGVIGTIDDYEIPEPDLYTALYVRGTMNDWGTGNKMNTEDGDTYTITMNIPSGSNFKIADADWGADYNYGLPTAGTIALNTPTTLKAGQDSKDITAGGDVTSIKFVVSTKTITLIGEGGGDTPVDPTPTTYDVYVVGGANDWGLSNTTYKFEQQGDTNVYTLTSDTAFAKEWKIRIDPSNWDLTYGAGDGIVYEPGTTIQAWCGSSTNFQPISGTVTVTFTLVDGSYESYSSTPATFTYTTEGGGDTPVVTPEFFLTGDFNSWAPADETYKFTQVDDSNVYTLSLESLPAGAEFKVKDASPTWSGINLGGEGEFGSDDPVNAVIGNNNLWQGSSVNLIAGDWINIKFTLTYNTEGASILNIEATEVALPDDEVTYAVVGPIFQDNVQSMNMTLDGTTATLTATVQKQTFRIQKLVNGEVTATYGPTGAGDIINPGEYTGKEIDANGTPWVFSAVIIPEATADLEFSFNTESMVLTISKVETPVDPDEPKALELIGSFNEWKDAGTIPMNYDAATQEYTANVAAWDGGVQFKIREVGNWDYTFGGDAGGEDVESVLAVVGNNTVWEKSSVNLRVPETGWTDIVMVFTYEGNKGNLKIDATTMVEDVTVDNNVAPVYYNLQGVRVDNPTNGLYIVVRGNKVTKEVIR